MLCGIPPFYNENLEKMYDMIKLTELRFPKRIKLSDEAQDIITQVIILIVIFINMKLKLLQKDPEKRLGYKNGFAELKQHPFFLMMNMDDILERKVIIILFY